MSDFQVESVSDTENDEISNEIGIHTPCKCTIRVVGVGGGGGNSVQHMINQSLADVQFIAVNTDAIALSRSTAHKVVQIGVKLTNGLGSGCDPNKGRKAAEESREDVKKLLQNSKIVFITAGMGGGTGTGASPIIAEVAKETGALTIAVVTKPFKFEGKRHRVNAEAGITELSKHVDSLIVVDNDKLLKNLGANISIVNAFHEANDVLYNSVRGIIDAIKPGYINLDLADVEAIMRDRGHAMIGTGIGQGANFVEDAIQKAIHSPLIEQVDISSAAGLLVHSRINPNFPIAKWEEVNNAIQSYADENADCKFGLAFDDKLGEDQISITILITGFSGSDTPGLDSSAAVARAQASIRRNNAITQSPVGLSSEGGQGHFFSMTQDGSKTPEVSLQSSAPNPFTATPNNQHRTVSIGGSGATPQELSVSNGEMRVGQSGLSTKDEPADLWEVPNILRNKAD